MMCPESGSDRLEARRHKVIFQSLMNFYYHESLEGRYEALINWTSFVSIVFASATFAVLSSLVPLAASTRDVFVAAMAFFITCSNAGVLAFGVMKKMETHRDLKREWSDLYGRGQLSEIAEESIVNLEKSFFRLNRVEPPAKKKILERAYRKACVALGLEVDAYGS